MCKRIACSPPGSAELDSTPVLPDGEQSRFRLGVDKCHGSVVY
jgi:hypothetical protein